MSATRTADPRATRCGPLTRSVAWREVDLRPESDLFDAVDWTRPEAVRAAVTDLLADRSERAGLLPHLTPLMTHAARRSGGDRQPATVHVGCTLLVAEDEPIATPMPAHVVATDSDGALVLRHPGACDGTSDLWSYWWGVESELAADAHVAAGERIGRACGHDDHGLGTAVQVQLHERPPAGPPPRLLRPDPDDAWEAAVRTQRDPAAFLDLRGIAAPIRELHAPAVVVLRGAHLAPSQRAYYRRPPKLVRSRDVWMYDEHGLAYLDSINNVTHVGHAEPRVIEAATRQMQKLNTNSRFLYEGMATYAERLVSLLPDPLEVVFLVCTGSEANDLALRIARQVTGRRDVVVLDGAYHGNTSAVMEISPNRYKGPGGRGKPATTHEVPTPDRYRGPHGYDDPDAGARYGQRAAALIDSLVSRGTPPAAFIAESLMGTAGNIVLPPGFLPAAFAAAHAAGALCVSDEVQVGVGRLGSHFWGFETHGVVPDIVTMGKPMGNGHPLAAVVTTRAIADAFDDGVKYFNTFGGNPVSCAVGAAVLDVVEGDGLQENARRVGGQLLALLSELAQRQELVGDVRGHGLYLGVELVRDRYTKEPASAEAMELSEALKDAGVLTYPTGAHNNVLKLKPPMTFQRKHAELYVAALDEALSTLRRTRP